MSSITESVAREVLLRYGDRAYYVLKAAIEVSNELIASSDVRLGDFDNKRLIKKLKSYGIKYNPNQLLRILERDYGLIETTYRSSGQHWWVFTDKNAVIRALRMYEGMDTFLDDPELYVLKLQIRMLDIDSLLRMLEKLRQKPRLSFMDKSRIKDIVMNKLPEIAKVAKKAAMYEDLFREFLMKVQAVFVIVEELVGRIQGGDLSTGFTCYLEQTQFNEIK